MRFRWTGPDLQCIVGKSTHLDFTLCLHQLQLGLGQLQLHLPQLVLQTFLLLVRLLLPVHRCRGHRGPHATFFVEEAPALLTAIHFSLEEETGQTEDGPGPGT